MPKNGYSLIEVLAAIMVVTVMMGVVVISFRGVTNKDRLKSELVRVAGIIREARGRAYNGVIPPGATTYPTGGYGIYLDKTTKELVLFADADNDNFSDAGETISTSVLNSKLFFTLMRNLPVGATKQVIKFNGASYPVVYELEGCPPSGPDLDLGILCVFSVTIPSDGVLLKIADVAQIITSGPSPTCNGQIKVSNKTSTVEPLLIDTSLVNC